MDKLQWGNRKLLRRLKLRDGGGGGGSGGDVVDERHDLPPVRSPQLSYRKENRWSGSESAKALRQEEKSIIINNVNNRERREKKMNEDGWGMSSSNGSRRKRLVISLSNKEKEEDFMKMKGCKPPQRPKKRLKSIQQSIFLLSPGEWLWAVCQERYQVREKKKKKTCKKKPSGLKAMEMDLD